MKRRLHCKEFPCQALKSHSPQKVYCLFSKDVINEVKQCLRRSRGKFIEDSTMCKTLARKQATMEAEIRLREHCIQGSTDK